jgi:hypothetical protein
MTIHAQQLSAKTVAETTYIFAHELQLWTDVDGTYIRPGSRFFVIPAQAGIQGFTHKCGFWIPAYAGMTVFKCLRNL